MVRLHCAVSPKPREHHCVAVDLPSGLFQFSCGDRTGWAEDPVVYRNGRLMLGIISHEGIAELRISKREEESLATIGLRGDFSEDGEPGARLS